MFRQWFISLLLLAAFRGTVPAADTVPDWSKFAKYMDVQGVIVKGDDDRIVLQVTKYAQSPSSNPKIIKPIRAVGTEDHDLKYAAQALVRKERKPTFTDDKGKERPATANELAKLRLPVGAPGYAAEKADLKAGHIVTVTLVRPTSIPAEKATISDVVIKHVLITGETKAPAGADKDDSKKKK